MITLSIPGFKEQIELHHLVLDYNGTLAIDGKLIPGVKEALQVVAASGKLQIHVITGDTYGTAHDELKDIPCKISILPPEKQDYEKAVYVLQLGKDNVISIGNGCNDRSMLQLTAIGVLVIQKEGASAETLASADAICTNVLDAIALIQNPLRLKATLRS